MQRTGVHGDGMAVVTDAAGELRRLADLLATGDLEQPIKARFPLDRVAQAYTLLAERHGLGKVVLDVSAP